MKSRHDIRLLEAITAALKEMERCPEDSIQDIWNEELQRWQTGLRMGINFTLDPDDQ